MNDEKRCVGDYTCEECGSSYHDPNPAVVSEDETKALFGVDPKAEDCVRLCHQCWLKLMAEAESCGLIDSTWRQS